MRKDEFSVKTAPARPVFLNLLQIHLPVGGVLSILHRITGVLLVLAIPVSIWILQLLYSGPQGYSRVAALFDHAVVRLLVFLILWLLSQHALSGIRHLLLDLGIGYELRLARTSAWAAFMASAFMAILLAVLLW